MAASEADHADWLLDCGHRLLNWCGRQVVLTRRELRIVETLAIQQGKLVRHETLYRMVWQDADEAVHEEKTLHVHVCRVRQRMRSTGMPRAIETVWGAGLTWQPPIAVVNGDVTVLSGTAQTLLNRVLAKCPDRNLVDAFCWAACLPLPPD
jgi:DNA-binding winged helix-turn-helix (wHTH) protein